MHITPYMIDFAEGQAWDEDVRQDVYVILLDKPNGYMDNASVEQLMTSIYNLQVLNNHRQVARRKELVKENIQAIEKFHGTDDNHDPLDYLVAEQGLYARALSLSPLLLSTLEDYMLGNTVQEIAMNHDLDINTVYQRMYAIKQELQNG